MCSSVPNSFARVLISSEQQEAVWRGPAQYCSMLLSTGGALVFLGCALVFLGGALVLLGGAVVSLAVP